jgi:DNA (cytosine-5)-methyltransferase 1
VDGTVAVFYNENDPYTAAWLRCLIANGSLPDGDVDERSITDVTASDVRKYNQANFFAGIGGWPAAFRLAGWPDDRPAWTGSCPCQPFSRMGEKRGFDDDRHLWPVWRNLIAECRPATVFGEQIAGVSAWLRNMRGDLEDLGNAVGATPFEAASAGSFHRRDRYWIVANCGDEHGSFGRPQCRVDPAEACEQSDQCSGSLIVGNAKGDDEWGTWQPQRAREGAFGRSGARSAVEWVIDKHGKSRPVESGVGGLSHGLSGGRMVVRRAIERDGEQAEESHIYHRSRVLKGFGNALDLRAASAFVKACMDILTPMCGWLIMSGLLAAGLMRTLP